METILPARAVPASTVLLVRDRPAFEVLMVTRHQQSTFAAGALVFPGGKVDPEDADEGWNETVDGWHLVPADQRALRIAAIREVFEEAGLLIALSSASRDCAIETITTARREIREGRLDFLTFARSAGIVFDAAQLVPFAHWITPEAMPKRFDTHFYLVAAASAQQAVYDGLEVTNAEWTAPAEALRLGRAKERIVGFPTRLNLQLLAESHSVNEALSCARKRPVVTVESRIEQRAGGRVLTIRQDAGYGAVEEPLSEVAARGHASVSVPHRS
ncbi:NUDIX hydrolase [Bradyrhizobium liaoningense]|uniref:NUDIX hydrolase n=1 Tax=Bradyrhizobium liaoningense TaxID=43992 RepID=UPI001BA4A3F0|nr:NUDIX domain-containing protein [Bradyrhizobium liaoningense]MBR0987975.1 NUDIX domain-containing protein [Bradyrhizobium liaoningense]